MFHTKVAQRALKLWNLVRRDICPVASYLSPPHLPSLPVNITRLNIWEEEIYWTSLRSHPFLALAHQQSRGKLEIFSRSHPNPPANNMLRNTQKCSPSKMKWTNLVSCFVHDYMATTAIDSLTIDIVRKVVSFLGSAAQWWIGDQYSPGWRFIGLSASVPQSPSFDSYQAHNAPLLGDNSSAKRVEQCVWRNENLGGIALVTSWSVFASCRAELRLFTRDRATDTQLSHLRRVSSKL